MPGSRIEILPAVRLGKMPLESVVATFLTLSALRWAVIAGGDGGEREGEQQRESGEAYQWCEAGFSVHGVMDDGFGVGWKLKGFSLKVVESRCLYRYGFISSARSPEYFAQRVSRRAAIWTAVPTTSQ
jgi:hypothetical protein